jgi:hypothetical protein
LELEIKIGFKIGSNSGTRNEPGHGSGTGTRIFENTQGKKILELLVNWLITIGFRPVYPEPETNLILESKARIKTRIVFFSRAKPEPKPKLF